MTGPLRLDPDALHTCIGCGMCLPHCPTWRVTGDEALSPRGRIALMREVEAGAPVDDRFVEAMTTCIQCRGCEPVCPAAVPYGHLAEDTRAALTAAGRTEPWWRRLAYRALGRHRLVLAGSTALALAQRARLVPGRLGLPRLPLRRPRLAPTAPSTGPGAGGDAWLFTGCVMDAWQRHVHAAALAVMGAAGATVAVPGPGAACCGALHVHAGLDDQARALAERVMRALPGDAPIVVDAAGCGAALKDYGRRLGTPEAAAFSARVRDVHEWLAARVDHLPPPRAAARSRVAVQDPCHLRHVQGAHGAVRTVLAPYVDVVELDDDGLCCGAGGAYSVTQPELAAAVRARKLDAVGRSGAGTVVSANPGCAMHLAAAGLDVRHPVELVAEAAGLG